MATKKEDEARSAELSGADLKSDTEPQPEEVKSSSATLSGGTKISGPAEVIKRLKSR